MLKDNFLDKESFTKLYNTVTSPFMPYFIQNGCAFESDNRPLLTHKIIDLDQKIHSGAYDIIAKPILEKLNAFKILRLKINCYPNSGKVIKSGWHVDLPNKHKVCLLNVNTNNGYTDFKNKDLTVGSSKENTALLFDGKEKHRSISQTDTLWRFNININYE